MKLLVTGLEFAGAAPLAHAIAAGTRSSLGVWNTHEHRDNSKRVAFSMLVQSDVVCIPFLAAEPELLLPEIAGSGYHVVLAVRDPRMVVYNAEIDYSDAQDFQAYDSTVGYIRDIGAEFEPDAAAGYCEYVRRRWHQKILSRSDISASVIRYEDVKVERGMAMELAHVYDRLVKDTMAGARLVSDRLTPHLAMSAYQDYIRSYSCGVYPTMKPRWANWTSVKKIRATENIVWDCLKEWRYA